MTKIDVYPVGWLREIQVMWRSHVSVRGQVTRLVRNHVRRNVRGQLRQTIANIQRGRWRELKNQFNGYLAEPTPWPEGVHRCGSGWTKKRALRSLRRQIRRPGVHWEEPDRQIEKILRAGG